MLLLHNISVFIFRYCPPSVISPSLTPCLNHPFALLQFLYQLRSSSPYLFLLALTSVIVLYSVSLCMKNATNWGLLSRLCFMREISNFLQPKLAQSSKKCMSPVDVLHKHSRAPFPRGNSGQHFWQQFCCQIPPHLSELLLLAFVHMPFPAVGLHTTSARMELSPATHNQLCQPSFSPRTSGIAAGMRRSKAPAGVQGSFLLPLSPRTVSALQAKVLSEPSKPEPQKPHEEHDSACTQNKGFCL